MSHSSVYTADTFVASAGSSLHLLRQQPAAADGVTAGGSSSGSGQPLTLNSMVVQHPCAVNTVRWNRNNKVVAAGCADGTIQLLYSSGVVMCVLPRDGTPPAALGSISSLSWSAGSKRLAAGSSNGNAYVFDMQNKHPMVALGGHLGGVTALEYQHEDKLLAVASGGGSVVAYTDPHRADGGGAASAVPLMPSADSSARLCLSVSSGGSEAALAAGSAAGGVTVWDVPTRRVREEWAGQHGGAAVRAVAFAPLRPGWLYSAGDDGRVVLQDRQAGPGHASVISVGAPAPSLMIKEDLSLLGVGTADGMVLLYDPRHLRQPLQTLRCGEAGQPITGLHWQHRYSSLSSSRHRSAAAAAAAAAGASGGGNAPSRLGMAPASSAAAAAAGATPGIAAAAAAVQPGSVAASAASARTAGAAMTPAAALKSKLAAMLQPRSAARSQLAGASDKRMSVSAPGSRAASPPQAETAAAAGAAAATPLQPRGISVQPLSAQPAPAAAAGAGGSGLAQITPLSRPPTAAEMPAITPLPGMAPRYAGPSAAAASAAAAMGEVTPVQQQFQQQRLGTAGAGFGSEQHVQQQESPLEQLAAAPMSLNITPLAGAPAARTLAAPAAIAAAAGAAAAGFGISPLSHRGSSNGSGSAAGAGALGAMEQFNITPLPGMPAAQPAASPKQRSVLGERTNSASVGGHGMLPRLALPLSAAPEAAPAQHSPMQASPSFAENLPSPTAAASPRPSAASKQQQQQQQTESSYQQQQQQQQAGDAAADAAAHKAKLVAAAQLNGGIGGGQLSPAASGSGASWYIGATPAEELLPTQAVQQQQQHEASASAAAVTGDAAAPAAGGPLEISFAAAQRSLQQLASGGGAGGGPLPAAAAGAETAAAAAGGSAGAPGLRDDILAMHLDMLTNFQAQQQSMGQMVSAVLERNAELSEEVAALRRQMAGLAGRRADFLWL